MIKKIFSLLVFSVSMLYSSLTYTPSDGSIAINVSSNIVIDGYLLVDDGSGNYGGQEGGADIILKLNDASGQNIAYTKSGGADQVTLYPNSPLPANTVIYVAIPDNTYYTTEDWTTFTPVNGESFTFTTAAANTAPTDISLSAISIGENQSVGSTVGILSATDIDSGDDHTFNLGCTGTDNDSFTISGTSLNAAIIFDYETKSSYSICVRVNDGTDNFDKNLTINIINLNDNAPVFTTTQNNVDVNVSDTFTYAVGGEDADGDDISFSINADLSEWLSFSSGGVQTTFAGTGVFPTYNSGNETPDGTIATDAKLKIASTGIHAIDGKVFFADTEAFGARYIDENGTIQTFFAGDGSYLTLNVNDVAYDPNTDTMYMTHYSSHKVVKSVAGGALEDVATGLSSFPQSLILKNNKLYVGARDAIYEIDLDNANAVRRIAGTATGTSNGYSQTGTATTSQLGYVAGMAFDSIGNLIFVDRANDIIRKVNITNDTIETIAGTQGADAITGDGGLATAATFQDPSGLAIDTQGRIFISERLAKKVRVITTDGNINNYADIAVTGYLDTLAISESNDLYIASDRQIVQVSTEAKVSGTPACSDIGSHDVNLTVTDGSNDAYQNFTITVPYNTTCNTAPSAQDFNITIDEDTNGIFSEGNFSFADVDGDSFNSIIITSTPATGTLTLNDADVTSNQEINISDIANLKFTPFANEYATPYTTFIFKVNDGVSNSTNEYTATINVTSVNDVPTFTTTQNDSNLNVGSSFSYSASGNDVDGDDFNFSATTLPSWLTLSVKDNEITTLLDLDTDSSNRLRILESDNNQSIYYIYASEVMKYNIETNQTTTIIDSSQGLNYPSDLALAPNGDLYIADKWNNAIKKWDGISLSTVVGLPSPDKIDIDSDGNIYIVSNGTQCSSASIMKWDGTLSTTLTNANLGNTCVHTIAVDSIGDVYFSAATGNIVKKYDVSEGTLASDISISLTNYINQIMIDANDNLYINGFNDPMTWNEVDIIKYDIATENLTTFISKEAGLDDPMNITFDPDGNVYIAEYGTDRLVTFSSEATLIGTPTCSDIGSHDVNLTVTDGSNDAYQNFTITVENNGSCNDTATSELQEKDTGISAPSEVDTEGSDDGENTTYTQIFTDANSVSKEVKIVVNSTLDKSTVTTANSVDTTVTISSTKVIKSQVNNNGTIENTLNNTGVEAGRINVSVVGADVNITSDKLISTYQKDETTSIEADLNIDGTTVHKVAIGSIVSQTVSSHASSEVLIDADKVTTTAGSATSDTTGYVIKSVVITDTNGESITRFIKVNENDSTDYTVVGNTLITSTPFAKGNEVELGTLNNGKMYILTTTPLENNLTIE